MQNYRRTIISRIVLVVGLGSVVLITMALCFLSDVIPTPEPIKSAMRSLATQNRNPAYRHYYAMTDGIEANDYIAVKKELDHGADPNVYDPEDAGPALDFAVDNGNTKVVELLLDCHADPNARDGLGFSPLDSAAIRGNIEVMRLLISRGAKVNDGDNGSIALSIAATVGNARAVACLLAHGANPNTVSRHETLLHSLRKNQVRIDIIRQVQDAGGK